MSLVEEYHAAHKARLARMGGLQKPAPRYNPPIFVAPVADPVVPAAQPPAETVDPWEFKPRACSWFFIEEDEGSTYFAIADIQRATCKHFGLTKAEFLSERRTWDVVIPRQIAMYLCKLHTSRSLPEIGRRFGGKDHTTVLHAVRKMSAAIPRDWLLAYDVAHIEGRFL